MTWHPSFARVCEFCGARRRAGHDEQCAKEKYDFWGDRLDAPVVVKPFPAPQPCSLCLQPLGEGEMCRCELTITRRPAFAAEVDW